MKGIIVYYSGTGSTAKVAKSIHRGMKQTMDCDILPVKKASPPAMSGYDVIGIGGPVWGSKETANLRLFAYNLPDMTGKLCFLFCTHGASPSGFMYSLAWALKKKGLKIIGYNNWYGSVFQVLHMPKPYLTDGHPDEIDLNEAEVFGRNMADLARKIIAGEADIPEMPKGPDADPLWRHRGVGAPVSPLAKPGAAPAPVPQRKIDTQKCIYPECTMCIDNCTVNAIDFSVSPPVIKPSCNQCSFCDKLCPQGAIELDAVGMQRRSQHKINMEKCKYPKCTICIDHCPMNAIDFSVNPPVFKRSCEGDDLCWVICPEGAIELTNAETAHGFYVERQGAHFDNHPFLKLLADAEAKGRFRWLTPLDKVGWDNLIYKMEKHPRFSVEELGIDD